MVIEQKGQKFLSTDEAAAMLHVRRGWITQLLKSGRLKGQKVGRDWVVSQASLEAYQPSKAGRPRSGNKVKGPKS